MQVPDDPAMGRRHGQLLQFFHSAPPLVRMKLYGSTPGLDQVNPHPKPVPRDRMEQLEGRSGCNRLLQKWRDAAGFISIRAAPVHAGRRKFP